MKKIKSLFVFLCFTFLFLAFNTAALAEDVVRIGITTFQTRTDGVSEFQAAAVGDVLARMLSNSKTIAIIERDRLNAVAAEHRLNMSGLVDTWTASEVGKLAGCQYMIIGSVTNLKKKQSGFGVFLVSTSSQEATATVDARVVDVTTGEVILSLSESGSSSQSGSMFSFYGITTQQADLSGMEGSAIAAAASSLGFKIRETLTGEYTQVLKTGSKNITIDAGATSGVGKGGLYRVYVDPENPGATTVAVVKIVDVQNEISTANVAEGGGKATLIQTGDKVSPISVADAKDLAKRKAFIKERPRKKLSDIEDMANVSEQLQNVSSVLSDKGQNEAAQTIKTASTALSAASELSKLSQTKKKTVAVDNSSTPVSTPATASTTNNSNRQMENQSTDPGKVIATYDISSGAKNTRRIAHLNARKLGNKEAAYDKYVELARSYNGDYLAAFRAGEIAQAMGDKDEAKTWFDKALSINPNYEPAQKAKEELNSSPAPKKSTKSKRKK